MRQKMLICQCRPISNKSARNTLIWQNAGKKNIFSVLDILPQGSVIAILVQIVRSKVRVV